MTFVVVFQRSLPTLGLFEGFAVVDEELDLSFSDFSLFADGATRSEGGDAKKVQFGRTSDGSRPQSSAACRYWGPWTPSQGGQTIGSVSVSVPHGVG